MMAVILAEMDLLHMFIDFVSSTCDTLHSQIHRLTLMLVGWLQSCQRFKDFINSHQCHHV